MFKTLYSSRELDGIIKQTKKRKGWDFSFMNTQKAPVPWEYLDVVSKYLKPKDTVLDIGTGGGEKFLKLAKLFKHGIGIDVDPEMIKTAKENAKGISNVMFRVESEKLENTGEIFDVILCRHAPYNLKVIWEHLKLGGYYITQQVGEKNMLNIKNVLKQNNEELVLTKKQFEKQGFEDLEFRQYDVEYIVKDVESLVFWLQALDLLHSDMSGFKALEANIFNKILDGNVDKRGFITNEHRYLVVAQKKN